ncbi:DUF2934 domain-containing protein [Acidithiobacillus sulfuriphilus]|uniref:DUF2934 domain-containing protein n=1 Tax=Acidithiobacillus sulfuriphilus TaxID=1867749 RepID=UPI003F6204E6
MAADTPKASPKKSSRSTASKASATLVEKPAASPRKTAAAAKAETTPAPAAPKPRSSKKPNAADREQMIAVRAYYLAEERGFAGGDCVADWLAAEEWVDGQFPKGKAAVS